MKKNKIINFGVSLVDLDSGKDVDVMITSIWVDAYQHTVQFTAQEGVKVTTIELSMEEAREIGFINVKALQRFFE